ncbi:hypothetical protein BGW41_001872 [Actinomortierella wolfii]|nr:hypothetical protein BGW41_001872 [Actinomortierella wolfii]
MEESEVRDGHHGGWVYANTLFVDLGSGNDDSSASEEEVPPATSSQLAIPSSVPVTMDSSSVYPNLEAALGESNILISVPVRVASAVSLPSPSSEEDKPEAQEVEYHDQQEVDEEDGSEEDHEDEGEARG